MRAKALVIGSIVVLGMAVTACNEPNQESCDLPENADKPACNGGAACKRSLDCGDADKPVCDLTEGGGTCEHCTATEHQLCKAAAPHCEDHACVECVDDSDCDNTGVCMFTGECVDPSRIIHAKVAGSAFPACGALTDACTLTRAFVEVQPGVRDVIKLDDPMVYSADSGFPIAVNVTIDARNATLRRGTDGAVVSINGMQTVTILGGTIDMAHGTGGGGGDAIRCMGAGKLTLDGTTLTGNDESAIESDNCTIQVRRSMISNNSARGGSFQPAIDARNGTLTMWQSKVLGNKGGGVALASETFTIVGNVLAGNGTDNQSSLGGISISQSPSASNRLDFNTIVNNRAVNGVGLGVQCVVGNFIASDNIIWDTGVAATVQVGGNCKHAYSDVRQALLTFDAGNNLQADPNFVGETDFRIKKPSPVFQKADPAASIDGVGAKDIAGTRRAKPPDIGAYVVPL